MKIICIGRNYAEHAKELNNPAEPVFFLKPDTAYMNSGKVFHLPDFSKQIHHEVELVIRILKNGKHITEAFAHRYYDSISVGIDFTARDIQQRCRENGLPWEPSKAFDNSAPVGELVPFDSLKKRSSINFYLSINGKTVQQGNSADMIFSFDKIVSFVSRYITLRKGDLIFTGTPKGVGEVKAGDLLEAFLEEKKLLTLKIK